MRSAYLLRPPIARRSARSACRISRQSRGTTRRVVPTQGGALSKPPFFRPTVWRPPLLKLFLGRARARRSLVVLLRLISLVRLGGALHFDLFRSHRVLDRHLVPHLEIAIHLRVGVAS